LAKRQTGSTAKHLIEGHGQYAGSL
jgi:hypothetical protein